MKEKGHIPVVMNFLGNEASGQEEEDKKKGRTDHPNKGFWKGHTKRKTAPADKTPHQSNYNRIGSPSFAERPS